MQGSTERPIVEIFLLKYKSPEIEARCVESILKHTHWPFHLHVVDCRERGQNMASIWNYLIRQHGHSYYKMFIDSDTVVSDGWLNYMMLTMKDHEDAGAVVPRTNRCGEARQMHIKENDGITEVPLASGFCFLFTKSAYLDCGEFDESYGFYGQDSEWFIRMVSKTDNKIYIDPRAFVHHEGSYSVRNTESDGYDFEKDKEEALKRFWTAVKEYGVKV